ncbi:hypothetical protein AB1N83_003488 [Pleurotus pulmonarius]
MTISPMDSIYAQATPSFLPTTTISSSDILSGLTVYEKSYLTRGNRRGKSLGNIPKSDGSSVDSVLVRWIKLFYGLAH